MTRHALSHGRQDLPGPGKVGLMLVTESCTESDLRTWCRQQRLRKPCRNMAQFPRSENCANIA
ncbi:MAG: hypothetical protein KDH93_19205 [Rhodoferax sp.]|nr:hypothetical protein [Rhodoferax sp.]MCP5262397.1 hypothetical protein [Rhodoferax sp.]